MRQKSDTFAGLSANKLCLLTGVLPQTRDTWVRRRLLEARERYGQLDLIEQTVVKALLSSIPKGQVSFAWRTVRPELRNFVAGERAALVWDPETQTALVTQTDAELSDAVRHGRPVHVLPLGELVKQARNRWQAEADAARDDAAIAAGPTASAARKTVEGRSGRRSE